MMLGMFLKLPLIIAIGATAFAMIVVVAALLRRATLTIIATALVLCTLLGMAAWFFIAQPGRSAGMWARAWTSGNGEDRSHWFFDSESVHRARAQVQRAHAEARREQAEATRAARETHAEARRLSRREKEPPPPVPPAPPHALEAEVDHAPPADAELGESAELLVEEVEEDAYIDEGPAGFHWDHDRGPGFFGPVESLLAGHHGKAARTLAFSLLSALAIGGFLGVGYVAFDSMTRGHFTWQLRILGAVAFLAMWLAASALRHW